MAWSACIVVFGKVYQRHRTTQGQSGRCRAGGTHTPVQGDPPAMLLPAAASATPLPMMCIHASYQGR
jgi:hypothetical protein